MFGKVLLVAIDSYKDVTPLNGCLRDAEDMYETLVAKVGYDPRNIRYLANDRATKANIVDSLRWLSEADHAFCFYAGHGTLTPDRHPAMVTYDCTLHWNDPLSDREIEACIGDMPGIMIFDCCHSGSMWTAQLDGTTRGLMLPECVPRYVPNPLLPPDAQPDMSVRRGLTGRCLERDLHISSSGLVYVSGCRDSESSQEIRIDGQSRGAFSYFFCSLLRENPEIAVKDAWQQTSAKIAEYLARYRVEQHPQLWCRENRLSTPIVGAMT